MATESTEEHGIQIREIKSTSKYTKQIWLQEQALVPFGYDRERDEYETPCSRASPLYRKDRLKYDREEARIRIVSNFSES